MKKINLLFLVAGLLVVLSPVGYAEIERKIDSFDGSVTIFSRMMHEDPSRRFQIVYFFKTRTGYVLSLMRYGTVGPDFANKDLEMKIGKRIYRLPIIDSDIWMGCYQAEWIISSEIAGRILKIDSITIRIQHYREPPTVWKIPSKILDEWKQVIEMKF